MKCGCAQAVPPPPITSFAPLATFGWTWNGNLTIVSDSGSGPLFNNIGRTVKNDGDPFDSDPWGNDIAPNGLIDWFDLDDGTSIIEILQDGLLFVQYQVSFDLPTFDEGGTQFGYRAQCGSDSTMAESTAVYSSLYADMPVVFQNAFNTGENVDHPPSVVAVQATGWLPWYAANSFLLGAIMYCGSQSHVDLASVEVYLELYEGASAAPV